MLVEGNVLSTQEVKVSSEIFLTLVYSTLERQREPGIRLPSESADRSLRIYKASLKPKEGHTGITILITWC